MLNILNPDYFLGGAKKLDVELAAEALQTHIGDPLGLSAEEAAAAVYEIQNAQTADLVRSEVVGAGYDPRDFMIYAFGGAGPVHCAAYGRDLQAQGILVPLGPTSATFSAYGLAALGRRDLRRGVGPDAAADGPGPHPERTSTRSRRTCAGGSRSRASTFGEVRLTREVDVRYTMQIFEVATPVPDGALDEAAVKDIVDAFEDRYAKLYGAGTGFSEAGVQAITFRVYGTGVLPFKPDLPQAPVATDPVPPVQQRRRALLDVRAGWQDVAVYNYGVLAAGHRFAGPAIVEAPTTTVVVPRRRVRDRGPARQPRPRLRVGERRNGLPRPRVGGLRLPPDHPRDEIRALLPADLRVHELRRRRRSSSTR